MLYDVALKTSCEKLSVDFIHACSPHVETEKVCHCPRLGYEKFRLVSLSKHEGGSVSKSERFLLVFVMRFSLGG